MRPRIIRAFVPQWDAGGCWYIEFPDGKCCGGIYSFRAACFMAFMEMKVK